MQKIRVPTKAIEALLAKISSEQRSKNRPGIAETLSIQSTQKRELGEIELTVHSILVEFVWSGDKEKRKADGQLAMVTPAMMGQSLAPTGFSVRQLMEPKDRETLDGYILTILNNPERGAGKDRLARERLRKGAERDAGMLLTAFYNKQNKNLYLDKAKEMVDELVNAASENFFKPKGEKVRSIDAPPEGKETGETPQVDEADLFMTPEGDSLWVCMTTYAGDQSNSNEIRNITAIGSSLQTTVIEDLEKQYSATDFATKKPIMLKQDDVVLTRSTVWFKSPLKELADERQIRSMLPPSVRESDVCLSEISRIIKRM